MRGNDSWSLHCLSLFLLIALEVELNLLSQLFVTGQHLADLVTIVLCRGEGVGGKNCFE